MVERDPYTVDVVGSNPAPGTIFIGAAMSNELHREQHSKRLHQDQVKIKKQVDIAKQHGLGFYDRDVKQPHRLAKRHAMDCGNPGCFMCGNPRKTMGERTIQERRFDQVVEE